MSIPEERPLRKRLGGASRLAGMRVYYDFDWRTVFGHDRATFPRGKSLARLVVRDCPTGKSPALLLTDQQGVTPSIRETADEYIAIVPIRDYLSNAGGDAASTYYARLSSRPLTQLPSLADIAFSSLELERFLDDNLTTELIAHWIGRSTDPDSVLNDLGIAARPAADRVFRELTGDDPGLRDELARQLEGLGDPIPIRRLLIALTELQHGRATAANVMGERLADRIADTRLKLEEYDQLIHTSTTSETDVQRFLEVNPWIVGLPYISARGRVEIPRGILDFVLDRFDGFFDVIELKGPQDPIVVEPAASDLARPHSASGYSLGPALAKALAQAHHYRTLLDQSAGLGAQYGLADTRQPKILILLGRSETLSESSKEILRQLNLSLHRVEVIPYDILGLRTSGLLSNVEALWRTIRSRSGSTGSSR